MGHLCAGICLTALVAAGTISSSASAQVSPDAPPPEATRPNGQESTAGTAQQTPSNNDSGLEDIVVTAQRRSENLREVPISVVAISPAKVDNLHLQNLQDLQFVTPGLTFARGINFSLVSIRGIGSFNTNPGLETAVATYIDGAYLERGSGAVFDVVDPQSIQVLRGAQGTLWGRNATGGAILINTADPTDNLSGRILGEFGNFAHRKVEGMINIPLSDTLSVRLAGRYRRDGGYVDNLTTGEPLGGGRQIVARGKVAYKPSSSFSAVLQFQYDRNKQSIDPAIEVLPAIYCQLCSVSRYTYPLPGNYTTVVNNVNGGNGPSDKSYFYNLKMSYNVGDVTISSVSALRKTTNFTAGDFDYTEIPAFNLAQNSGSRAFTQSLQIVTDFSKSLNLAAGFDYLDDRSRANLFVGSGDVFDFSGTPVTEAVVDTTSVSGFAELRFRPMPAMTITAGGRFTHDARDGRSPGAQLKVSFNSFTPRLVLAYDTGSTNLYASYNRGFKAGGFSGTPVQSNVYRPESVDSYEVGAKYQSEDRKLRASLAAFLYKYRDIQVTGVNQGNVGNIASANNAGAATGRGAELEVEYQPSTHLYVFGGVSWLDASYDRFDAAQVQVPLFNPQGQPIGFAVGVENLAGMPLPRAPRWSGNVGFTGRAPLGSGWTGEITPAVRFSSRFYFTDGAGGPLRSDQQSGFAQVNITARMFPASHNFEVNAFISNLTNKAIDNYRFSTAPFGAYRFPAQPRTYGLGAIVNF